MCLQYHACGFSTWNLEKYTQGLRCIFKLKDSKTGNYVYGLNIVLLCWSDGKRCIPLLFHLYRGKGVSNLDLAMKLLAFAHDVLKLNPDYVLFDSYYGSRALIQQILRYNWHFVTRLKKNRKLDGTQVKRWRKSIPYWSTQGCLEGKIPVVVYRHGAKYFVSSNLDLTRKEVRDLYKIRSLIEETIRVLKQKCGWQGCQLRSLQPIVVTSRLGYAPSSFWTVLNPNTELRVINSERGVSPVRLLSHLTI